MYRRGVNSTQSHTSSDVAEASREGTYSLRTETAYDVCDADRVDGVQHGHWVSHHLMASSEVRSSGGAGAGTSPPEDVVGVRMVDACALGHETLLEAVRREWWDW